MCVDQDNNIYKVGLFYGTADLDPGAGISNLTSAGEADVFILKLNPDGNFIALNRMGGPEDDLVVSIVTNSTGSFYITGRFESTADFNPGTEVFNLRSAGNFDAFIVQLTEVLTQQTEVLSNWPEMIVFPNPANKTVNFSQTFDIVITNAGGQLIVDQKNTSSIDLEGYPAGVYFYSATSELKKVNYRGKIMKTD